MTAAAASVLPINVVLDPADPADETILSDPAHALQLTASAPRELIDEAYWVLAARVKNMSVSPNAAARYIDALNGAYESAKRGGIPGATAPTEDARPPRPRRGWRGIFSTGEVVRERRHEPNHYELLCVQPHADREIIDLAAAFLRRHKSALPVGDAATREVAYHTLGDPALRAEYDLKLGLLPAVAPLTGDARSNSERPSSVAITTMEQEPACYPIGFPGPPASTAAPSVQLPHTLPVTSLDAWADLAGSVHPGTASRATIMTAAPAVDSALTAADAHGAEVAFPAETLPPLSDPGSDDDPTIRASADGAERTQGLSDVTLLGGSAIPSGAGTSLAQLAEDGQPRRDAVARSLRSKARSWFAEWLRQNARKGLVLADERDRLVESTLRVEDMDNARLRSLHGSLDRPEATAYRIGSRVTSEATEACAELRFTAGPRSGEVIPIGGQVITLGESGESEGPVEDDANLGRRYGRVWRQADHYVFRQLDDAPVTIGGESLFIPVVVLEHSDHIKIGEHELVFTVRPY